MRSGTSTMLLFLHTSYEYCAKAKLAVLSGCEGRQTHFAVNQSDTSPSWASVSSCIKKGTDSALLRVCSALWCSLNSSSKKHGVGWLHVSQWKHISLHSSCLVAYESWLMGGIWQVTKWGRNKQTTKKQNTTNPTSSYFCSQWKI